MKRFTKLLYVLVIFSMLLMPYTTVYAEDTPGGNTADGTPVPTDSFAGPSAEGDYLGGVDPSNQRDIMMRLEIPYYNAQECAEGTSPSEGESAGTASGKDNKEKVFNFLRTATFGGHKLNAAQIAGIMGNLMREHGFQTNSTGNGFHGLAQWGKGRWSNDMEGNIELQLKHLKAEMDSGEWHDRLERGGFFNLGNSQDDAIKATFIFARNYEVCINGKGCSETWQGEAVAAQCIQNWNTEGKSVGRKQFAIEFYNEYSSKVDGPAPNSAAGYGPGRHIWFGDSRTVGMRSAVGDNGDIWIAQDGKGYDWFNGDGLTQVNLAKQAGDTIVINFGVNDPNNVKQYIKRINELASTDWKNNKVVVMSVNPVEDGRSSKTTDKQVDEFNKAMKAGLNGSNIQFVDTNSTMKKNGFNTKDGLHYTVDTYKKLHDDLLKKVNDTNSTTDAKASDNCAPSENGSNDGATKYGTSDGYDIYNQADFAKSQFGSTNVKDGGCGPSAMAMIISALTGKRITPAMTAAYGGDHGGEVGGGSSWNLPEILAQNPDFGIKANKIEQTIDKFNEVLSSGGMVWACGRGAAPFTGVGHCIGIRGRTDGGKWKIFDSGTPQNSYKEWDPTTIINGIILNGGGSASAVYAIWYKNSNLYHQT